MPIAKPETMVSPDCAKACAKARVLAPCAVALRLPTIASAGRLRSSRRPTKNNAVAQNPTREALAIVRIIPRN
jgi:hypothetical protein